MTCTAMTKVSKISVVFDYLANHPGATKEQIAAETDVSSSSLHSVVYELMKAKAVTARRNDKFGRWDGETHYYVREETQWKPRK